MSLFKGNKISVEIYGESHAEKIGVICKGFPKIKIDREKLKIFTDRRKPSSSAFSTSRKEPDETVFLSGVNEENQITSGDFEAVIYNKNQKSNDYNELYAKPRPSHADYCSFIKNGTLDFSGGGRFSARLTAPLCIAGGIAKQYLEQKNIKIYAFLSKVGKIDAKSYKDGVTENELKIDGFPSIDKKQEIMTEIEQAKKQGDSVGAVIDCVVLGLKAGVGDDYFSGLEGKLSYSIFSIPAVKGIEFGSGFSLANMYGEEANDCFYFDERGEIKTFTNHSGGVNGGISNGMPITFRVAFRPTPSIFKEQRTIDLVKRENTTITIKGRHDSCVAVRAVPVVEGMTALALLDELLSEEI